MPSVIFIYVGAFILYKKFNSVQSHKRKWTLEYLVSINILISYRQLLQYCKWNMPEYSFINLRIIYVLHNFGGIWILFITLVCVCFALAFLSVLLKLIIIYSILPRIKFYFPSERRKISGNVIAFRQKQNARENFFLISSNIFLCLLEMRQQKRLLFAFYARIETVHLSDYKNPIRFVVYTSRFDFKSEFAQFRIQIQFDKLTCKIIYH